MTFFCAKSKQTFIVGHARVGNIWNFIYERCLDTKEKLSAIKMKM